MILSNKYSEYARSEIEWVGDLPVHWTYLRLVDLVIRSKSKNTGMLEDNLLSLSYGKIKRKNIHTTFGLLPESFETYQIIKEGDIILRLTDLQNDWKSLRVGLAKEKGIITSAYICIRPSREVHSPFLYYLLHYYDLAKVFYWQGGGLRQSMKFDDVKVLPVFLPPLPEQKAIAGYLDRETERIDRKVGLLEEKARLYKELKQSLINETVTRGLDKSAPLRPSGVDWIGEIPEHWRVVRNKDLFRELKRKAGLKSPEYDVLSLTLKGVIKRDMVNIKGKMPASFNNYLVCKPNDLVLCLFDMDVTPRIVGLVKDSGMITSAYTLVEAIKGVSVDYFLYYYLAQNKNGSLLANSKTLRSTMTFDLFCQIEAPLPPTIEEQQAIAEYLDEKTIKIDQIVEAIGEQVKLLKELRKTLINDVVTGKIRVTETEEAAS